MAQDQRVEWLLAAQVTGQNELQRLTLAVGKMREEIDALKTANGGLALGMANVSRSMGNANAHVQAYRKHLDEQAKAMRNTRQGTQQLGMQFNDLGTSIATGASPIQAFNQQLGQIGYAMSMMGGKMGAVGAFLAGPWGAAITIATMVIGPMIAGLFDMGETAKEAADKTRQLSDAHDRAVDAALDYEMANNALKASLDDTYDATEANISAEMRAIGVKRQAALEAYNQAKQNWALAKSQAAVNSMLIGTGSAMGASGLGAQTFGRLREWWQGNGATMEEQSKLMTEAVEKISKLEGQTIGKLGEALAPKRTPRSRSREDRPEVISETDKLRMAQQAVIAEYESGSLTLGEFEAKLNSVTDAFKDAKNPAEDWFEKFKKANEDVKKFKDLTEKLTSKSVPEYVATLRDLEQQYESLQKSEEMTAELQVGFMRAIKATATGPIDDLIKKYDAMHTGTTQMQQDLIAAKTVMDNLSKETGEASGIGFQAAADAYGRLSKAIADAQVRERNQEIVDSFKSIGMSVSDAFKGMITGATSWKDAMKGIIASVINELWKLFVVQQIVGFVSKTIGGIFNPAGAAGGAATGTDWTAGMRSLNLPTPKAIGGSVGKNRAYMVGERGPELFIPGGSGTIIPNRNLGGGGGGGNAFNINVDARGSADPAAVRAQVQQGILEAAPAIIAAAEARTVNGLRRPRLGGVMQ